MSETWNYAGDYDLLETGETGDQAGLEGGDTPGDSQAETALQVQEAAERLNQIAELEPQAWQQLDAARRLEVLQNVESQMAEIQGRPALPVVAAEMSPSTYGQYDGQQIQINAANLAGGELPPAQFVDTIVHEGRHAYQDYAVQHPGFHSDPAEVQAWAENFEPGNYLDPETYGMELYQTQPLEADAWNYAALVTEATYGG